MSRRWFIFLITSANFFLSQFYRASNAVIANDLIEDLALDTQGLGTISAAFFYAFALTQIPISIFLDRIGPRRMMTGLSLLGIAGALIFACAHSIGLGLVGRTLLGMGMACNLMGTLKLMTVWFGSATFATLTGVIFLHRDRGKHGCCNAPGPVSQCHGMATGFYGHCGRESASGADPVRGGEGHAPGQVVHIPSRAVTGHAQGILRPCPALEKEGVLDHLAGKFSELWYLWRLSDPLGRALPHGGHGPKCHERGLPDPYHEPWIHFGRTCLGDLVGQDLKDAEMGCLRGSSDPCLHCAFNGRPSRGNRFFSPCVPVFSFGFVRATGLLMYVHIKESMPLEMAGTAMTGINFFTMIGPALFLQGLGIFMQSLYPESSRGVEAFTASFLVCACCFLLVAVSYLFTRDTMHRRE